jgi:hypothetical protein
VRRKMERVDFLSANPKFTLRFAMPNGGLCRAMTIQNVARRMQLDWRAVKELDKPTCVSNCGDRGRQPQVSSDLTQCR